MKLHIIHTNDLHGHLEKWLPLSTYVHNRRQEILNQGDFCLLFDIGDAIDAAHPLVEASQGQIIIDLFNQLAYDYVTLGNNEGLNQSKQHLSALYQRANFQVICANLIDQETQDYPSFLQAYQILDLPVGRLAIIGLTAPYMTYAYNGYHVLDSYDALSQQLKRIKSLDQPVDKIVLLSHLGIRDDRLLAKQFPELDLILGAHTHHLLMEGEWQGQTLLGGCGRFGEFVGEVVLDFEQDQMAASVKSIEEIQDLTGLPLSHEYSQQGRDQLRSMTLVHLPFTISAQKLTGHQSFIQYCLEALIQETDCQLAFLATGLFLADLPIGPLTMQHLHESLPHSMHAMVLEFQGWQLVEVLDQMISQEDDLENKLVAGNGFRGKIFGRIIFQGIERPSQEHSWRVLGQEIRSDNTYRVVTLDHYAYVPFFPLLGQYGHPQIIFPNFIRQIVGNYLINTFSDKGVDHD